MRYILYGAGAIGSILGGHLCHTGARVVLVGPARHVRVIQRRGLKLRLPESSLTLRPKAVTRASSLAPFEAGDIVLLCAKSHQTLRCLSQLRAAGAPRTLPVFCCQNSFVNEPLATLLFDRVYGVAVYMDGIFIQPGEAVHASGRRHGHLEIGRYPSGVDRLCRQVARDLRTAGFSVRTTFDVMPVKRAKFVINLANAVIAITNQPEQAGPLVRTLRVEAVRVLRASGMACEAPAEFRRRAEAACGPLRVPADAEVAGLLPDSTWQSLYRRTRNIETPFFNGLVVQLGRSLSLPTPGNEFISQVAASMARRGERPGKYTVRELVAMMAARRSHARVRT